MQNKKERKIYIPPEVVMLSEPAAYTDLCSAGTSGFTPAGCQGGVGDSVYCLVGVSTCNGGSGASGGCSSGPAVI